MVDTHQWSVKWDIAATVLAQWWRLLCRRRWLTDLTEDRLALSRQQLVREVFQWQDWCWPELTQRLDQHWRLFGWTITTAAAGAKLWRGELIDRAIARIADQHDDLTADKRVGIWAGFQDQTTVVVVIGPRTAWQPIESSDQPLFDYRWQRWPFLFKLANQLPTLASAGDLSTSFDWRTRLDTEHHLSAEHVNLATDIVADLWSQPVQLLAIVTTVARSLARRVWSTDQLGYWLTNWHTVSVSLEYDLDLMKHLTHHYGVSGRVIDRTVAYEVGRQLWAEDVVAALRRVAFTSPVAWRRYLSRVRCGRQWRPMVIED